MRGDGLILRGWTVVDRGVNPAAHLQETDSIYENRWWTVVDPNLVKDPLAKRTDSRQVVRYLRGNIGGGRSTGSTAVHLNQISAVSLALVPVTLEPNRMGGYRQDGQDAQTPPRWVQNNTYIL